MFYFTRNYGLTGRMLNKQHQVLKDEFKTF